MSSQYSQPIMSLFVSARTSKSTSMGAVSWGTVSAGWVSCSASDAGAADLGGGDSDHHRMVDQILVQADVV